LNKKIKRVHELKAFLYKKHLKIYNFHKDCIPDKLLFLGHKHRSFLVLSLFWGYLEHPVKIIVMRFSSMYFMFVIKKMDYPICLAGCFTHDRDNNIQENIR
jgi:hypothetical protein